MLKSKTLTPREMEVAFHVVFGYEPRQISQKLGMSVKTVESYQAKIYKKLGIQNRPELIRYVIREDLIPI